jgi:hypothetical protein
MVGGTVCQQYVVFETRLASPCTQLDEGSSIRIPLLAEVRTDPLNTAIQMC